MFKITIYNECICGNLCRSGCEELPILGEYEMKHEIEFLMTEQEFIEWIRDNRRKSFTTIFHLKIKWLEPIENEV